jgi:hypothetical protein
MLKKQQYTCSTCFENIDKVVSFFVKQVKFEPQGQILPIYQTPIYRSIFLYRDIVVPSTPKFLKFTPQLLGLHQD